MKKASGSRTEIYQLALHTAPIGIMVVGDQGDIQYVNQTLADMFGHNVDDLLGKPVEILIPEPFAVTHRHHVKIYARRPEPRSMGAGRDLEGVSKDNRRFPVEIGLRPVQTSSGRVVVATVIDITKRKAIEERLRKHEEQLEELVAERTQELSEAQREKERVLDQLIQAEKMTAVGTLVSGINHEIHTEQEGDWVTVRIRDNGAGIRNEHLKRVFDPFLPPGGRTRVKGWDFILSVRSSPVIGAR